MKALKSFGQRNIDGCDFMKKNILDVLKEIKAGVIKSIQLNGQKPVTTIAQDVHDVEICAHEPAIEFVPIEDNPVISCQPLRMAVSTPPETRFFKIEDPEYPRKIAYTVSGDMDGDNILICLPGLLETKESFMVIHAYFLKFENCKVISVDFSGRGESDYIKEYGDYKMSLYLSDISKLIQGAILNEGRSKKKITVLGTSMGGVLAMYLTKILSKKIDGIILNDIALTVNWTSLYALYKSMKNDLGFKEVRELAKDLSVDLKAISDVQLPGHFDLSYKADVWGMNFHEALEGFKGKVGLIYGAESKICTKQRVEGAKSFIPQIETLEVPNVGHPAPFNLLVCDFIQSQIGV